MAPPSTFYGPAAGFHIPVCFEENQESVRITIRDRCNLINKLLNSVPSESLTQIQQMQFHLAARRFLPGVDKLNLRSKRTINGDAIIKVKCKRNRNSTSRV